MTNGRSRHLAFRKVPAATHVKISICDDRQNNMIQLRLTTNPGIEDVVEQELRDRAVQKRCDRFPGIEFRGLPVTAFRGQITQIKQKPFNLEGQVFVEGSEPALSEVSLQMRSVFYVMRQVHHFLLPCEATDLNVIYQELLELDFPEMDSAQTFRVTTQRSGQHPFQTIDVQGIAGAALIQRYGKAVSLEDYEVNVRVDLYDRLCLVSVQQNRERLDRRQKKVWQPRITLKPTIASAMLQLCKWQGKGRLLDPFCGSGTILIEAATVFPHVEIYGSDHREEAVIGVQDNITAANLAHRIQIQQLDARDLETSYPPSYFRAIVTNPPYGMRLGSKMNFDRLYFKFLRGAEKILEPGGRIVSLVGKGRGAFKKIISELGTFKIREQRLVKTGELYPHLFICDRK